MGKRYVNTGNSDIAFGNGVEVLKGKTVELSDDLLKEKADAIETLVAEGKLTEPSKIKPRFQEEPKKPEKPEKPEGKRE